MIEKLQQLDTTVFYAINGLHNSFFDKVFWVISAHWSIGTVLVLSLIFMTFRKEPKTWWLILAGIALCFLFADRISVMCFKDIFCRLRPCHALENVHLVNGKCGGQYGFVSSHAANVFALVTFLSFVYQKSKIYVGLMITWGLLVIYSRVYLGVHYPGDVLCGTILGIGLGSIVYFLYSKAYSKVFLKKQSS